VDLLFLLPRSRVVVEENVCAMLHASGSMKEAVSSACSWLRHPAASQPIVLEFKQSKLTSFALESTGADHQLASKTAHQSVSLKAVAPLTCFVSQKQSYQISLCVEQHLPFQCPVAQRDKFHEDESAADIDTVCTAQQMS
jgi:hypothetical protein